MNKVIVIATFIVFVVISVFVAVGVVSAGNKKYQQELQPVLDQQAQAKEEISKIREDKDLNNFLPSEVVKYFVAEVNEGSLDKAKLYVSKDKQDKDMKAWLGLEGNATLSLSEVSYTVSDDSATVVAKNNVGNEESTLTFELDKENNNWKITEITGD